MSDQPRYGERAGGDAVPAGRPPASDAAPSGFSAWGVPSSTTPGAPTCPRHPGVVSYVRCQRCNRPTCPQCQRPAPVGVRCADCAREAQSHRRVTRTVAGARARPGKPFITYGFLALNVLVFLAVSARAQWARDLLFAPVIGLDEPWRFMTSGFLHTEIWHILLNMYALWITGPLLEAVLGRWRFAALYLLSLLGGSVAVLALANPQGTSWFTGVLGASGAVFGLFGAMALTMRRLKRAEQQILVVIAINVVFGFVVPGIAWQAHLGGLFVGAALAALYLFGPKKQRQLWAVLGTLALAALIGGIAVWKYASIGWL